MKKLLGLIMILVFALSCESDLDPLSSVIINNDITIEYLLGGDLDMYMDNQQVFRYKGKPGIETITIGSQNLADFENCFILHIASGSESEGNVSSAIITLDGLEVLNVPDFSNEYFHYTFEVCNLSENSVLEIEIRGAPGTYLDIWIEGKLLCSPIEDSFTDPRDNTVYKTVKIGDQIWMAENLNYDSPNSFFQYNDPSYGDVYGRLYSFYEAQEVCPAGWHLPSDDEWKELEMSLGMSQSDADIDGTWRGTDEGGVLKATGTELWVDPNVGATNCTGFNGLPGGCGWAYGLYQQEGTRAWFWTSTEENSPNGWCRALANENSQIARGGTVKGCGFSVRCVKD